MSTTEPLDSDQIQRFSEYDMKIHSAVLAFANKDEEAINLALIDILDSFLGDPESAIRFTTFLLSVYATLFIGTYGGESSSVANEIFERDLFSLNVSNDPTLLYDVGYYGETQ